MCARQHKVAEAACYRLERILMVERGVGAPHQRPRVNQKRSGNVVDFTGPHVVADPPVNLCVNPLDIRDWITATVCVA